MVNGFSYSWKKIFSHLQKESAEESNNSWNPSGRIGPAVVGFKKDKCIGELTFDDNTMYVSSRDNFSTVMGNVCVYKGKWQYEVMLGTKGVMQIGWATLNSCFSQESGVGDTPDSFAYDGNRQRKWNVSTCKYGEKWTYGDIISCLIDLDQGRISYLRNGHHLGIAFNNVKVGPGIAYFPATSLALDECFTANLGSLPFHFPQKGFQSLERPPTQDLIMAKTCLLWLVRIVWLDQHWNEHEDLKMVIDGEKKVTLLILAHHIGTSISSLLESSYITEATLFPLMNDIAGSPLDSVNSMHEQFAHRFLDYLMSILPGNKLRQIGSSLILCLLIYHKKTSASLDFLCQKRSLSILHLLLSHTEFRKFCLKFILFEDFRFVHMLSLNCIDEMGLKSIPGIKYLSCIDGSFPSGSMDSLLNGMNRITTATAEVEGLQMEILQLILTATDGARFSESSRSLFLTKFRTFLMEVYSPRTNTAVLINSQDILNLFCRCFDLFLKLWKEEIGSLAEEALSCSIFYDGTVSYQDMHRLGGLESHLNKTFIRDKEMALKEMESQKVFSHASTSSVPSTSGVVLGDTLMMPVDSLAEYQPILFDGEVLKKRKGEELKSSLMQYLDGIIFLYHSGGHKQMERLLAQSDSFFQDVEHFSKLPKKKETYSKTKWCAMVLDETERSTKVMEAELKERSYQHTWKLSTELSLHSVCRLKTLLQLVLEILKNSSAEGPLFAFVPEFYIEVVSELCSDLKHLFVFKHHKGWRLEEDTQLFQRGGFKFPSQVLDEFKKLMSDVGEFLALHFWDSRIVYGDSKDSLIQALGGFVIHKPALDSLEKISLESRRVMVGNLLQPYENRAWAQNNWILVRFWKGKGFGFRYLKSPHMKDNLGPQPAFCDIPNTLDSTEPCPSEIFLNDVGLVLQNPDIATPFVNSLLNQLNWVFSEFIGMLQEIQNASSRPERIFIDSRQLRLCATCFDLALALVRVLEMVVNVAVNVFLDLAWQNSQSLLRRLCQLICQVLNRVSVATGCFSHIVNLEIPGLETIHYFPLLTAVTGILCRLLHNDIYGQNQTQTATGALLSEESFQMSSLYRLVCGQETLAPSKPAPEPSTSINSPFLSPKCSCKPPKFCFRNYTSDIDAYEIDKVVEMLRHLERMSSCSSVVGNVDDADSLCSICYARKIDAKFIPCNHTSCIPCITHHLMNKSICFFCKAPIKEVFEIGSSKLVFKGS